MCRIFTTDGAAVDVSKTNISVQRTRRENELPEDIVQQMGPSKHGYQITTYGNTMLLPGGGVMVVGVDRGPIVLLGSPMIDGKDVFQAVKDYVEPAAAMTRGGAMCRGGGFEPERLAVVRSGDFNVSIAEFPDDLLRLSDKMGGAMAQGVVDALLRDELKTTIKQSFVVFQLAADAEKKANNSLAFIHRLTPAGRLSIPLKHNGHDKPGEQFTTPERVVHDATLHVYDTQIEASQRYVAGIHERPYAFFFGDHTDLDFRARFAEAFRRPQDKNSLVYPPSHFYMYKCQGPAANVDLYTA